MTKKMAIPVTDLNMLPAECKVIVMGAARDKFKRDNPFGVFAMEIGPKRVRGNKVGQITLVVYVERKQMRPSHHVPALFFEFQGKEYSIIPDVVATGKKFASHNGFKPSFTGIHPGSQIIAEIEENISVGAVSLIFHTDGTPQYLVTAGHLFPPNSNGLKVKAAPQETDDSYEIGKVLFNLLDDGTPRLDVAVILLNQDGSQLAIDTTNCAEFPQLSSSVPYSNLAGIKGQAFLPMEHQYSLTTLTNQYLFTGYMESDVRGQYEITDVLQTDRAITQEGDSGTALFCSDYPMIGIGSCIGVIGHSTLVEHFDRSLRVIRQLVGKPINLWHGDQFGGGQ